MTGVVILFVIIVVGFVVINLFTGTIWQRTHYDCRKIVLIMRGVAQGTPTRQLADELGVDYGTLLTRRHRIQQ